MLEVDMKTTIKTLYQKGYNKTQIGRMPGIGPLPVSIRICKKSLA